MNDDFISLLGQPEEAACAYLSRKYPTCKYRFIYTCSPFQRDEDKKVQMLKKVIRIRNKNDLLEILITYFALPSY